MSNTVFTESKPSDVLALLAPPTPALWTVEDGRPGPGVEPPFVSVWPIDPLQIGEGAATEDWGQFQARWFVYCTGATVGQTQWLVEQVLELDRYGDRWILESVGTMTPEDSPTPSWWFTPFTLRDTQTA